MYSGEYSDSHTPSTIFLLSSFPSTTLLDIIWTLSSALPSSSSLHLGILDVIASLSVISADFVACFPPTSSSSSSSPHWRSWRLFLATLLAPSSPSLRDLGVAVVVILHAVFWAASWRGFRAFLLIIIPLIFVALLAAFWWRYRGHLLVLFTSSRRSPLSPPPQPFLPHFRFGRFLRLLFLLGVSSALFRRHPVLPNFPHPLTLSS